MFLIKALIIWLGFFVLAFLNGALREGVIRLFIDEPWAHHLSVLSALILFTLYLGKVKKRFILLSMSQAIVIGFYWLILTILTETFIVGRIIAHLSWEQIIENYNVFTGHFWPLVLLWIFLSPMVVYKLSGKRSPVE